MLKALVRVVAHINGERTEFKPGEEVTGLHPHDERELLKAGSLEDTSAKERQEKKDAAAEKAAQKAFIEAREAALQQRASTQPEEAGDTAAGKKSPKTAK